MHFDELLHKGCVLTVYKHKKQHAIEDELAQRGRLRTRHNTRFSDSGCTLELTNVHRVYHSLSLSTSTVLVFARSPSTSLSPSSFFSLFSCTEQNSLAFSLLAFEFVLGSTVDSKTCTHMNAEYVQAEISYSQTVVSFSREEVQHEHQTLYSRLNRFT